MEEPEPKCSRCENALDTSGSPKWCKACRAKYQREYQELRTEMAQGKGFAAGAERMRLELLRALANMHPGQMLQVGSTAQWIRDFPVPRP